jgi:hypothetical protein
LQFAAYYPDGRYRPISHRKGISGVLRRYTTENFPPGRTINIINVKRMGDPQIQQGTSNSNQTFTINKHQEIREIIESLEEAVNKLPLQSQRINELQAEIRTIEEQLSSSKLKINIIAQSLSSAKTILESVPTLSAAALLIINKIGMWLQGHQ